jgi:hypothetical protein
MLGDNLRDRLEGIVRRNPDLMAILQAAQAVNPPQWVVGAGIIRDLVWDELHGRRGPLDFRDVDLAFFDGSNLSEEHEADVERQLRQQLDVPWDAKNQARVHLWFEAHFGQSAEPLRSIEDAVATWPETAVCVAVRLRADDVMEIIAPLGLRDLFDMVWRRNPRRVSVAEYRWRLGRKRVAERWPLVRINAQ